MRTTVSISDGLLAAAKDLARARGRTLGDVIDEALRRELAEREREAHAPPIPVFRAGTGPRPGVDLTSSRAWHELLDEGMALDERR